MIHEKVGHVQSTAVSSALKATTPELLQLPLLCACQGSSALGAANWHGNLPRRRFKFYSFKTDIRFNEFRLN